MKTIESIKVEGACRVCRKFLGVTGYAGRAQARPYQRISWGLLVLANAEKIHSIKNLNIEFIIIACLQRNIVSSYRPCGPGRLDGSSVAAFLGHLWNL
jgi:hypothetical protein